MRWAVELPPPPILAELRYEFDGTVWSAVVTRADRVSNDYLLWIQRGNRYQRSGTFANPKALVKYIRETAQAKFGNFRPTLDTLGNLVTGRPAASVVPTCFQKMEIVSIGPNMYGSRDPKCKKCPYQADCLDATSGRLVQPKPVADEKPEEPEELFIRRLREKLQGKKWGA